MKKSHAGKSFVPGQLFLAFVFIPLFFPALPAKASITIQTGEIQLNYSGLFSGGNPYSEKDEPLRNTSLIRGGVNQLRISGTLITNVLNFDMTLNADFNNPDKVDFRYNRLLLSLYDNNFYFGSLPLGVSSAVNNTNNIYGVLLDSALLPGNKLRGSIFGAAVKPGFDSAFYPTYVYGLNLSSVISRISLNAFYMRIVEQEQAVRFNSVLQSGFTPTQGTVNKITARNSQGSITKSVSVNMNTDPVLEISIVDTGDKNFAWQLDVDDLGGSGRVNLQYITSQAGIFKYRIQPPTGWVTNKSFTIYLTFYNTPKDLSDNSLYVDYLKIYNPTQGLYDFEDFSSWIIPADVTVDVLKKSEVLASLPSFYLPYQTHYFGFKAVKNQGVNQGSLELGFSDKQQSSLLDKQGYMISAKLSHKKDALSASVGYDRTSSTFDIGPLSVIPEPKMDFHKDEYFFLGPASFFGNWIQQYLEIVAMPDYLKLTGQGGEIYKYFDVDLDKFPVLSIKVDGNKTADFEWAITVEDDTSSFRLDDSSRTGIFTYDIRAVTGWKGKKHLKIRIQKGIEDLYLYWVKFWRTGVARKDGFGEGTQLFNASVALAVSRDFSFSAGFKAWDELFSSYNVFLNMMIEMLKQPDALLQINGGLAKNRGDELENIESYPLLYEYFGVHGGIAGHFKSGRFEITESRADYSFTFDEKNSVSLVTYNFGVRYLLWAWLGYSLHGRNGTIVDSPLNDFNHEFSLEKEIPLVLDSTLFLKYLFAIYVNTDYKEWQYRTNILEIGIKRQSGILQNLLDFRYKIGEFGDATRFRYDSYILTLETRILL
jgi:hypothetical protein